MASFGSFLTSTLSQATGSVINAGASLASKAFSVLNLATPPAKTVIQSNLVKSAVNQPVRSITTEAPSLFSKLPIIGGALDTIFRRTPAPNPAPAPLGTQLKDVFSSTLSAAKSVLTGGPGGGLIGDVLRSKLSPAPSQTSIFAIPAATAPSPATVATVLQRETQPVGSFNVGFPAQPPAQSTTDITIAGPQGDGQQLHIPTAAWAALGLLLVVGLLVSRRR